MSDKSATVTDDMHETKERHRRYLRAINNPLRRDILRNIESGNDTIEKIAKALKLDKRTISWHVQVLLDGYCLKQIDNANEKRFLVTREGTVVEFLDKE